MQINLNKNYSILYQMAYSMSFKEFKNKYCLFNVSQNMFYIAIKDGSFYLKEMYKSSVDYEKDEIYLDILIKFEVNMNMSTCYYKFLKEQNPNERYQYFFNYFTKHNHSSADIFKLIGDGKSKFNESVQQEIEKCLEKIQMERDYYEMGLKMFNVKKLKKTS